MVKGAGSFAGAKVSQAELFVFGRAPAGARS